MSPGSLDQPGYLEVMIPAFTELWNNNTLGPRWTGLTGLPGAGQVCVCVFVC